jgi:hypothetical protein
MPSISNFAAGPAKVRLVTTTNDKKKLMLNRIEMGIQLYAERQLYTCYKIIFSQMVIQIYMMFI